MAYSHEQSNIVRIYIYIY